MIAYLEGHFRYSTASSWNGMSSYAKRVKLWDIKFPNKAVEDRAWKAVSLESAYWGVNAIFRQFAERYGHGWQIGFNGRSSGYCVLYSGGTRDSGYRSYCPECGQRNYTYAPDPPAEDPKVRIKQIVRQNEKTEADKIRHMPAVRDMIGKLDLVDLLEGNIMAIIEEELENIRRGRSHPTSNDPRCGRCNHGRRVNYEKPLMTIYTECKGTDEGEDFPNWETASLKDRVDLIWDFDKTVDRAIEEFIRFCRDEENFEEEERDAVTEENEKELIAA